MVNPYVARYRSKSGKRSVTNYTTVNSMLGNRHEDLRKHVLTLCGKAKLLDLFVLDMRLKDGKYIPVVAPPKATPEGPDLNTKYLIRSFRKQTAEEETTIETKPSSKALSVVVTKPPFQLFRVIGSTFIKR